MKHMKSASIVTRQSVFAFVFAVILATAGSIIAWTGPTQSPPNGNVAAPLNTGATAQTKTGDLNITGASGLWATGVGSDNGYCIGTDCITAWSQAGGGSGSSQWTTTGNDIYYNTGNVGIGTASPAEKLQISNGSVDLKIMPGKYWNGTQFISDNNFTALEMAGTKTLNIADNLAVTDGSVGIGTASPSAKLHVYSSTPDSAHIRIQGTRIGSWSVNHLIFGDELNSTRYFMNTRGTNESANANWRFYYYNTGGGSDAWQTILGVFPTSLNAQTYGVGLHDNGLYIDQNNNVAIVGNVTAAGYFHSSDASLKNNISTFSHGLDVIKRLRGVTFSWKKDDTRASGVIAQEVEQVMPEAVQTDEKGVKSVDYDQLIAPMIEAIKEQQKHIETQQKQIDAQGKRIVTLEHQIEAFKASR